MLSIWTHIIHHIWFNHGHNKSSNIFLYVAIQVLLKILEYIFVKKYEYNNYIKNENIISIHILIIFLYFVFRISQYAHLVRSISSNRPWSIILFM
jgi:hypothetical protein